MSAKHQNKIKVFVDPIEPNLKLGLDTGKSHARQKSLQIGAHLGDRSYSIVDSEIQRMEMRGLLQDPSKVSLETSAIKNQ